MKTITKISQAKFKLRTENVPNSDIELDFAKIIDQFKLKGSFSLLHWQAKPKGYRQWGIYSSLSDSYISVEEIDVNFGKIRTLQLDDKTVTTVPSAVIYYPSGQVCLFNNRAVLGESLIDSFSPNPRVLPFNDLLVA